jgi:hypothetical protein
VSMLALGCNIESASISTHKRACVPIVVNMMLVRLSWLMVGVAVMVSGAEETKAREPNGVESLLINTLQTFSVSPHCTTLLVSGSTETLRSTPPRGLCSLAPSNF